MQIVYEYVNISASKSLEALLVKKISALEVKYPFVIRADIFLKKENRTEVEESHCSIRLSMPGPRIHASSIELTFEAAVNETIRDLEDQLARRKDKMSTH